jgi:hypothetical protein
MPAITVTLLGLQPEPHHRSKDKSAKSIMPSAAFPPTAWQWHAPNPQSLLAQTLQHSRARRVSHPAASACDDDPDARLLVRFAPTANPQHTALYAMQADLAADPALRTVFNQLPDCAAISRIAPVHLQAGTDHAVVMGARYLHLNLAEWLQLSDELNAWLANDGLSLLTAASGRQYLIYTTAAVTRIGNHDLPALGCALNRNAQPLLAGTELRGLRRWLTEAQMWLYAHPINARRAAQGQAEINSLWLWGRSLCPPQTPDDDSPSTTPDRQAATPSASPKGNPPLIYTDSAALAGALSASHPATDVLLSQSSLPKLADLPARVLAGQQPLHLVWSEPAWCYLEGDVEGWQRAMQAVDEFLQALSAHSQTPLRLTLDNGAGLYWPPKRHGIMGLISTLWRATPR